MQHREVLMKTWVVVASAARARIFESKGRHGSLRELKDMLNPEDRRQSQVLKSDKPGRAFDHIFNAIYRLQQDSAVGIQP